MRKRILWLLSATFIVALAVWAQETTSTFQHLRANRVSLANQGSTPATPPVGFASIYTKTTDKKLYLLDETGLESVVGTPLGSTFNVRSYGAKGDARTDYPNVNATFNSTTTTTATDMAFTSADVGKAISGLCNGGVVAYPNGTTITAVGSGTSLTTSAASLAGCGGYLIVGTDDTAAFQAADAAATPRGVISVPPAGPCTPPAASPQCGYLVQAVMFNVNGTTKSIVGTSEDQSRIFVGYNFVYTGSGNGELIQGFVTSATGATEISELTIDGLGYNISNTRLLILLGSAPVRMQNVTVQNWSVGPVGSSSTCIRVNSDDTTLINPHIVNCADTGLDVHSMRTTVINPTINQGSSGTQAILMREQGLTVYGGSIGNGTPGVQAISVVGESASGNDMAIYGTNLTCGGCPALALTSNAIVRLFGVFFGPRPGHGTSPNMTSATIDATSVLYAQGTRWYFNGTGKHFTNAGKYIDGGGNVFTQDTSGFPAAANVTNSGTIPATLSTTGTVLVTGNVALTSGWGTSTVTTAAGDSHRGQFVISVTGAPGASPVVTLTFPTPYAAAPASCSISQIAGTFTLTNPATSGLSATSVAFTWTGTPVAAQSYTFSYSCGP